MFALFLPTRKKHNLAYLPEKPLSAAQGVLALTIIYVPVTEFVSVREFCHLLVGRPLLIPVRSSQWLILWEVTFCSNTESKRWNFILKLTEEGQD